MEGLKAYAKTHNATMFMVLLSALQLMLHRSSQQETVVVGSPIANRRMKETESLLGFFVNAIALKGDFSDALTVKQLIQQIKETTLEAYAHQDIPFEQLLNHLQVERQINVNPLFQVMLACQEVSDAPMSFGGLEVRTFEDGEYPIAKFDLTFSVMNDNHRLMGSIEYAKDIFQIETIERMFRHFRMLLSEMIKVPETTPI